VVAYNFNEGSGTLAHDATGHGNVATLKNGLGFIGGTNAVLTFDGVNDYADAPNSSTLNIVGSQITASAWVNFANTGEDQIFLGKPASTSGHVAPYFSYSLHGVYVSATQLRPRFFLALDGARHSVASSVTITPGWHYLAGTYDGSTMRIYVDGTLRGEEAASGQLTGYRTPLRLGMNGGGTEAFKGLMDNVRIYPRALTAQQLAKDMPLSVK
jgi:hypothetical protein